MSVIDMYVGAYGQDWRTGVLSEEAPWTVTCEGEVFPVLCSEMLEVSTEDGPIVGRCGRDVVAGVFDRAVTVPHWCEGHAPAVDPDEVCRHGLAAWLCGGAEHYA